jgi:cephalosporin-C deacetylase-like acetyl esterase
MRATAVVALSALALAACQGQGQSQGSPQNAAHADRPTAIYKVGENVTWTFQTDKISQPVSYRLTENNQTPFQTGTLDLNTGQATLTVQAKEPAMLYGEATLPNGKKLAFGAAVEPDRLKPAQPKPKDFESFWQLHIDALHQIPENPQETPGQSPIQGVDWSVIRLDHINGTHVWGQFAKPSKPGKYPAIVMLQWASPPYALDKSWIVGRAQQGFLIFDVEPHDVMPDQPRAYYDALPRELKNYAYQGIEDRETNYFLAMYLRGYRAVDYITHRPDWNGKVIILNGGSMGGQQSLCVAGLHPKVTHVIVEEPAGCDLLGDLAGRQVGYPFWPKDNPKVRATAPYFDAVNFAGNIKAKSLVAMGFLDTVAPPAGIWVAYNQIKGPKEAAPMVEAPHNNLATQAQQQNYYDRAEAWFRALAAGNPVEVRD